jgi:hypothetical protein
LESLECVGEWRNRIRRPAPISMTSRAAPGASHLGWRIRKSGHLRARMPEK